MLSRFVVQRLPGVRELAANLSLIHIERPSRRIIQNEGSLVVMNSEANPGKSALGRRSCNGVVHHNIGIVNQFERQLALTFRNWHFNFKVDYVATNTATIWVALEITFVTGRMNSIWFYNNLLQGIVVVVYVKCKVVSLEQLFSILEPGVCTVVESTKSTN